MTGLNSSFALDNGRFLLSTRDEKAVDTLRVLAHFDVLRIYTPDYDPGFAALQQKNASYLLQFRTVITGRLLNLINKYVPDVNVEGINIVYTHKNRKEYGIFIAYTYSGERETKSITVSFVG